MSARRDSVAALLLAAGAGRRFGAQKLLHPLGGAPLVRRTAERALTCAVDELVVVVGSEGARVAEALAGLPLRTVTAADWSEGMAASLRTGIAALDPAIAAVVILLGDQPETEPAHVDPLVAAWRGGAGPVVAADPGRGDEVRPPVLFDRALFPELLALRGDRGARAVVARDPSRVALVPLTVAPPRDVDVPADLTELDGFEAN